MNKQGFFEPPKYNLLGRQSLWIDACVLAHDSWCGCNHPVAHFIDSVLPIGHKDRDLTVQEILSRDLTESCHSGGQGATVSGMAIAAAEPEEDEGPTTEELEKIFTEDALQELIDAAERDEEPR